MDTKKDFPCCVYGPPEMMFRKVKEADAQLRKRVEVVAAIIVKDDEILATQRGYGSRKGWWEFPGGKVEPGESREDALVRELREEMDASIVIDRFLTTVEYDYPDFHLTMHCYLCALSDGRYTLREHFAARWLAPDDFDAVRWLPADVEVLQALRELFAANR